MGTENSKIIKHIKENYKSLEKGIVNQLYFEGNHPGTTGSYREKIWKEMFKNMIPKKFVIEQSVFLIDSQGNVSREVDLAIFDEMYTPYIFRYYNLKFIPIEAVAVVIECKSTSMEEKELKEWANSISALKTSSSKRSFARMATMISNKVPTQTATRPLRILCCLNGQKKCLPEGKEAFDVIIRAKENEKKLSIKWSDDKKNLFEWYQCLNHAEKIKQKKEEIDGKAELEKHCLQEYEVHYGGDELSLMTFNFQLNQILMLINNPMLFPHLDYVGMFNKFNNNDKAEGGTENE